MAKVVLEKLAAQKPENYPEFFKNLDKETFGIEWTLHKYQQVALENALHTLFYYYNDKAHLQQFYKEQTLEKWKKKMGYSSKYSQFGLLSQHFNVENDRIPYSEFINRASFWMATGSGKTLVMIKMLGFLHQLAINDFIPKNDILILAPKNEILEQIKEHISIYNKNSDVKINLCDLREFEKQKHLQTSLYDQGSVTVFYYRSDNITDEDKTRLLNYQTVLNNGKWYVLLDEAHKGEKEDSIRQAYYSTLASKGFMFNFSATFTDTVDIVTTAYNFNLKKFVDSGFGKHINVSGQEYKNWKKKKSNEFSEKDKTQIVVKSLLVLTAIKKEAEIIKKYNPELYHNPLLITIANQVNTVDAELKIFFQQLARIASGKYDLEEAKDVLSADLMNNKDYQFNSAEVPSSFVQIVRDITKKDILQHIFNASSFGKIEYTRILNNSREVAFRLKTAKQGEHFCLLVASDATKWGDNVLEDYDYTETPLEQSYFDSINNPESSVNILLGSRIFTEGWDSNRPNVMNFINYGIQESAQKAVLQAIGRGVRIQPVPKIRKRLKFVTSPKETEILERYISSDEKMNVLKHALSIESLFLFATKKEVIKNITNNLGKEKTADDWKTVKNVQKTKIPKDLLIPKYQEEVADIPAYNLAKKEYDELIEFVGKEEGPTDKIMMMETPTNISKNMVSTLEKIRDKANFELTASHSGRSPMDNLLLLNNHFHQKPKKLKSFEPVLTEINHFEKIEVANIQPEELKALETKIKEVLNAEGSKYNAVSEIIDDYNQGHLDDNQLQEQMALFNDKGKPKKYTHNGLQIELDTNFLAEHYYNPILLASDGEQQLFKHIVWVPSEVRFLKQLNKKENRAILDDYGWWYFSKIDESTDDVSIPYYNSKLQEYKTFFPDFIFWLKEKNSDRLIIKFIDPKGKEQGLNVTEDKKNGYENIFKNHDIKYQDKDVDIELYFYNDPKGIVASLRDYFTMDFEKMFRI